MYLKFWANKNFLCMCDCLYDKFGVVKNDACVDVWLAKNSSSISSSSSLHGSCFPSCLLSLYLWVLFLSLSLLASDFNLKSSLVIILAKPYHWNQVGLWEKFFSCGKMAKCWGFFTTWTITFGPSQFFLCMIILDCFCGHYTSLVYGLHSYNHGMDSCPI